MKIKNRFMVFTCNGGFIDEAEFDDSAGPYSSEDN